MRKQLAWLLAAAITAGAAPVIAAADESETADDGTVEISYNYDGSDHVRRMEKLGRGLAAVKTPDGVFLSWRLLGNESSVGNILSAPAFEVYKNGSYLETVSDSTNYIDPTGTASDVYSVAPVWEDGSMGEECGGVTALDANYFDIPLTAPEAEDVYISETETERMSFQPSDVSCGDLDGDGEYELVVKWINQEVDVGDGGYAGTVHLDAYKLDGTRLWENDIALGRNIYSSAHTLQFLVYDFDGDGKAEVICQTSLGSKDGNGEYVSKASADPDISGITDEENANTDYRLAGNNERILTGEEFLTVFCGETGAAADTIKLPTERVSASVFGDDTGNRSNRFAATVAYLDGERPYAVYLRGYYFGKNGQQRTSVCGVSFTDGRLESTYNFDTLPGQTGYTQGNEIYVGNGNHNITVADVDDDGKDEVLTGALCLEADENNALNPKWCTFLGHGDALHIGDYDPTHKGLEFFTVHEEGNGTNPYTGTTWDFGASVIDAETGEILYHKAAADDTGRGLMANVGAGGYFQVGAAQNVKFISNGSGSYSEASVNIGTNFRIFWDADLYDETLDGTTVSAWDGKAMTAIFNAAGCVKVNGTKSNPSLQADLFGDWREELVYPTADYSALRVYTTTELTAYKLPTLMHDPVYRSGVAAEQTAYNQPPHIGFYLADEIFRPAAAWLEITKKPDKTDYDIGELLDTSGLEVTAHFDDGSESVIEGYMVQGFDPYAAEEQTITVTYSGQTAEFNVTVHSGFSVDEDGYITGYSWNNEADTLPSSIDGTAVVGFADGALKDSALKALVVTAEDMEIGEEVFPDGITVTCYLGSDIYVYCIENGVNYSAIDPKNYSADLTFSEEPYSGFSMKQSTVSQKQTIGHIIYGVGARTNGAGDNDTGFEQTTLDGEEVLKARVGNYAGGGRNAYFTLTDLPALSKTLDSVFETDIMAEEGSENTILYIFDSASATVTTDNRSNRTNPAYVDYITSSAGIQAGVWYTYRILYHDGAYYRSLCRKGETAEYTKLNATPSESGIVKFMFVPKRNNMQGTYYLDNLKVYTSAEFPTLTINAVDRAGNSVSKPSITIDGTTYAGDRNGSFSTEVNAGLYEVTVEAEGYLPVTKTIGAYTNPTVKNIVLEPEYVELEGIRFSENAVALKAGQTRRIQAVTEPADATEQGIIYTSSNTAVAAVDSSGTITAVGAGTAVITAVSVADSTKVSECTVTVYDYYSSVLTSVRVIGDARAYIPNNAIANRMTFTAQGYDQNGVAMDADVTWTVNGGLTISDGTVMIPAGTDAGLYTVAAKCSGLTGTADFILESYVESDNIIAEEKLQTAMSIVQGTTDVTKTIDDITYHSGARSDGGRYTGFIIDDSTVDGRLCLKARTGAWASSNREAYMVFDRIGENMSYDSVTDYVFESDIYFDGTAKMVFSDFSGAALIQIEAATLGLDQMKWYHYMLVYSNGEYSQYVTDMDGNSVEVPSPGVSDGGMIAQIHFLKGTENEAQIALAGLRYYKTANAVPYITIHVTDGSGSALEGAAVTVGDRSETTNASGNARFALPIGAYNVSAAYGGLSENITVVSAGGSASYTIPLMPAAVSEINGVEGSMISVTAADSGLTVYAAAYDGGALTQVKVFDTVKGTQTFHAGFEPDKVFLWKEMMPVDSRTQ